MSYQAFVSGKLGVVSPAGLTGDIALPDSLFPHQQALTRWALRKGRAAIFADTGLGKSRMQIAWADAVHRATRLPVLILAPLAVAQQTAQEGQDIGVGIKQCADQSDIIDGINITNYDRLHRFDPSAFGGVVLDESSIIKHHDAKTFTRLTEAFRSTPYKLCATATPAPNDWTELGTHAEFLGVVSRQEMLAEFFTHDGGDTSVWRLKGHARHVFWRWVCHWGALVRRPSDLGFEDSAYELPKLHLHEHAVETEMPTNGMLFASEAQTLSERRDARRRSLHDRTEACASIVYGEWFKLATLNKQGAAHGLEEGIRGSSQAEGIDGPGIQGPSECSVSEGQGGPLGVHEGVLRGEPGQVQAHTGTAGGNQRSQAGEVRSGRADAGGRESSREGLAARQSDEAQGPATEAVRDRDFGLQRPDGDSGRGLRDLRALGHVETQFLPGGGSLPHDGQGARASVHELQSGAWQVQGQCGSAVFGNRVPEQAWLIWCELNDEQDALERLFGDLALSVRGSDTADEKERAIRSWLSGDRPVMISKPSIMGFGLNFQHCQRMAFVGVTDSFESYYQAVRRCWRFGQKRDVHVHVFASSAEGAVIANLRRKERDALAMAESLSAETHDAVMQEVTGTVRQTNDYAANQAVVVPSFLLAA